MPFFRLFSSLAITQCDGQLLVVAVHFERVSFEHATIDLMQFFLSISFNVRKGTA